MRVRAHLAEFLGTGLITATVVGSGIMAQNLSDDILLQLFINTFATVMVLALAIWLLTPVSGAYFNPAVVFIAFLRKKESLVTAVTFSAIQIVGAAGGAIVAHALFSRALIDPSTNVRDGSALFISEIVATAGLITTIFIASNQGRGEQVFWLVPMWIGSAYVFTSSTSFVNPAITLGRSLTNSFSGIAIASVPLFIAAQFIGALLGHMIANLLVKPVQK
jgi:glycerol uptake facilitator-like aquaporin|uniref:aquaporin n=1 Tax=Candidatus Planktophila sp. TaxID=2175601 RepID=UPI00404AEA67